MATPIVILGVLLGVLSVYTVSTQLQGSAVKAVESNPPQAASPIPYGKRALAGSWGGFSKSNVSIRLVVRDVQSEWALVLFAWGKDPEESNLQSAMWTRAKILSDGRLSISHPVHLVLTLSEDSQTLVGTTVHADPLASVLLTRADEEQARTALRR